MGIERLFPAEREIPFSAETKPVFYEERDFFLRRESLFPTTRETVSYRETVFYIDIDFFPTERMFPTARRDCFQWTYITFSKERETISYRKRGCFLRQV